jgi:hypothetical protein
MFYPGVVSFRAEDALVSCMHSLESITYLDNGANYPNQETIPSQIGRSISTFAEKVKPSSSRGSAVGENLRGLLKYSAGGTESVIGPRAARPITTVLYRYILI